MMGQATEEVAMQAETTDIPELPTEDIQGTFISSASFLAPSLPKI
jgi:hypothetical protein